MIGGGFYNEDAMTEVPFDENSILGKMIRSIGPFGFVAADTNRVNLDDLLAECRPGRVVRVNGDPSKCIAMFAPKDAETLGCVAGWISDET